MTYATGELTVERLNMKRREDGNNGEGEEGADERGGPKGLGLDDGDLVLERIVDRAVRALLPAEEN